jgi:hypothetical protein
MDNTLTTEEGRAIIFSENEEVRQQFVQHFQSEIDKFILSLTRDHLDGALARLWGRAAVACAAFRGAPR